MRNGNSSEFQGAIPKTVLLLRDWSRMQSTQGFPWPKWDSHGRVKIKVVLKQLLTKQITHGTLTTLAIAQKLYIIPVKQYASSQGSLKSPELPESSELPELLKGATPWKNSLHARKKFST